MKKILSFVLSLSILFSSYIGVFALQPSALEKTDVIENSTKNSTVIDQSKFKTLHPGDVEQLGFSASVIYTSLSAQRQANGDVTVIINETVHTVRGYYEHLATDSKGENFVPSKNTAYYTPGEGVYSITLPADSVSDDGYVYIKFAFAPVGGDLIIDMANYKIPVDYNTHKVNNDNYLTLEVGQKLSPSFSAEFIIFDAKATRQTNNDVEVLINIDNSNVPIWFNHKATSKDGDIFIPHNDAWYNLGSGSQTNKSYRFVLPENNVSSDGYVYLELYYELPIGMQKIEEIKLSIN